jgi:predicted Zn-dependent protease
MEKRVGSWHNANMCSNIKSKYFHYSKLFLFVCISTALIFSPVIRPARVEAFSIGDEKKIGVELLSLVRKSFKLLDEPDISQYVTKIGNEILQVTGVQFFDYHFFVINDPEFNAFAAPSGLIFIHSGLIEEMDNEGELISVLAHECGHVTSRHIADRIKKMTKTSIATAALLIAGIAMGGGALSEALITGSMAAGSSANLKFSRQDEEEADRLAFEWMKKMGTDPSPMASMLSKMHKISVYRMANIPPYLLTHPEPKRRLGYIQDLLLFDEDSKKLPQRDNFQFLRIKQRILSLTKKPASLSKLSDLALSKSDSTEIDKTMAHYGLYLVHLGEANFEEAEEELSQVLSAYPSQPILLADKAMIFFKEGKYDKALPLFLEAQEQDPSNNFTNFNLARTWQEIGENEKALRLWNDLLVDNPDYSRIHYQIGQIKTKQNKKGEGHYYLGLYFWYEGDPKMAEFHMNQALSDGETPMTIKAKARAFKKTMAEIEKE